MPVQCKQFDLYWQAFSCETRCHLNDSDCNTAWNKLPESVAIGTAAVHALHWLFLSLTEVIIIISRRNAFTTASVIPLSLLALAWKFPLMLHCTGGIYSSSNSISQLIEQWGWKRRQWPTTSNTSHACWTHEQSKSGWTLDQLRRSADYDEVCVWVNEENCRYEMQRK